MNRERFVELLVANLVEQTSDVMAHWLERKKPLSADHKALAEWFQALSDRDKTLVQEVCRRATDMAAFRLFTILDGAGSLFLGPPYDADGVVEDGAFEVRFVPSDGGPPVILNGEGGDDLHDIHAWVARSRAKRRAT